MKKGRKRNMNKYSSIKSLRRGDPCNINGVFYDKEEEGRSIISIAKILKNSKQNINYFLKKYGDPLAVDN